MHRTTNSGRLLIHVLGGPAIVAGLLHPPVEKQTAFAWAKGDKDIPQARIEQLAALQKARR